MKLCIISIKDDFFFVLLSSDCQFIFFTLTHASQANGSFFISASSILHILSSLNIDANVFITDSIHAYLCLGISSIHFSLNILLYIFLNI